MPIVSVIVPVYKVEKYIRRCVDSVIAQTFTDFELILVDDGSPDDCGKICESYKVKDSRIHVIHQENGGLSAARNAGIDWVFNNSNSKYFTFIDSDDWVHPQYLELLYQAICRYDVKISMCKFKVSMGEECETVKYKDDAKLESSENAYTDEGNGIYAYAWGRMIERDLLSGIRYPNGKLFEDVFTTHKIFFSVKQIAVVDARLYYYFQNEEGITYSKWSLKKMDEIEAFETVIRDCKYTHPNVALLGKKHILFVTLPAFYRQVLQLDVEDRKKYMGIVRKKMRRAIFLYGKECGLVFKKNTLWYEIGFPHAMHGYWILCRLLEKITRRSK